MRYVFGFTILAFLFVCNAFATTTPNTLTYQGRIENSGTPLTAINVDFMIEIRSPDANDCLLYSETISSVDMSGSNGMFSLTLGVSGNRTDGQAHTFMDVFDNSFDFPATLTCGTSNDYTPSANDGRKLVLTFNDNAGSGNVTLSPAHDINAVPFAMIAQKAQNIGSIPASNVAALRDDVTHDLNQSNLESIFTTANYTELLALLAGTSSSFMQTSPSGDVSFNNNKITDLADPTAAQDAATKNYTDANLGGNTLEDSGVGPATGDGKVLSWNQAANRWEAVDPAFDGSAITTGTINKDRLPTTMNTITMSGVLNMNDNNIDMGTGAAKIIDLANPTNDQDAATKKYVDDTIATNNASYVAKAGDNMTGALTLDAQNELRLADDAGGDYISFKAPAGMSSNFDYTLPPNYGTSGHVLTTDGAGVLTWQADDTGAGGSTLDGSYDQGGAGAGRAITVDTGAVQLTGSNAGDETLEVTNSAAGGVALFENTGSGLSLRVNDEAADTTPFVVDADGNVGFGTDAPRNNLHAQSTLGTGFRLSGANDNTTTGIEFEENGGSTNLLVDGYGMSMSYVGSDNEIRFAGVSAGTVTDNLFVIERGGNVGVGTAAPGGKLHISAGELVLDGAGAYLDYKPNNVKCANNEVLKWIDANDRWECGTDNAGAGAQTLDETYDQGTNTVAVDAQDVIWNLTSTQNFHVQDNGGAALTVLNDGNVGVGIAAPTAKLHVSAGELVLDGAGAYLDYKPNNTACADGEVLKWVNANDRWECGTDDDSGVPTSRDLAAGTGLTGGGDLTADRTFNVIGGDGIVANADDIAVDFTADKGLHFVSNKLEVEAGSGIALDANGVNVDVNGLTAETTPDGANDTVMIYDASNTALRKMTINNLTSLVGGSQTLDQVYDQGAATVTVDGTGGGDVIWNLTNTEDFKIQDNGTDAFVVDDSGNVGIGTASPGGKLHVSAGELVLDGAGAYLDYKPNNVKCANNEVLKWIDANDRWECGTDDDSGTPTSRDLAAGTGLTGGGDLTADRTFNVIGGDGIVANADDIAVDFTADKGLHFVSNKLEVEAGTGITLNASGVNVDVGTTANKIVQLNGSAELPAVDGSNLTGITASQVGALANVVEDTTPQLGGTLDMNGQNISTANGFNIDITGSASGDDLTVDTDKLVVEGDTGNVGVGTATPGGKLEVAGGTGLFTFPTTYTNGIDESAIFISSSDPAISLMETGAPNGYMITAGSTGQLMFHTGGLTGSTVERVRLDSSGAVGIGTSPDASALLDVSSTTKGFLPPRMTTAQRAAVSSPAEGLVVFDTDEKNLYIYQNSAWAKLADTTEIAFRVHRNSSSITNDTPALVDWNTEDFDSSNVFNLATDRFQPTVAGYYFLSFDSRGYTCMNNEDPEIQIFKNGTEISSESGEGNDDSVDVPLSTSVIEYFNGTTDYAEAHAGDDGCNGLSGAAHLTNFEGFLISGGTGGGGGGADHLGNHVATQNIILGSHYLSGDGGAEGLQIDASGNATLSNNLTLGDAAELRINDDAGGEYISFKSPTGLAGNVNYTLPPDDGNANDVLQTDGAGVLTWTAPTDNDTTYTADGDGIELSGTTFNIELNGTTLSKGSSGLSVNVGTSNGQIIQADATGLPAINGSQLTNLDGSDVVTTATGNVAATNADAAIAELEAEKLALAGGTMSGAIAMGTNKITGMGDPTVAQDASTKNYVDAQVSGISSTYVAVAGDTMTGNLTFSNAEKIIGGTSTTADLTLQTTTGVGATGADMHFLVGNNGATEAMTILNNGNVGVGIAAPTAKLHVSAGELVLDGAGAYLDYKPNNVKCGDNEVLKWIDANDRWECGTDNTGAGGETNTASNIGTAGVGVFKQKTGVDFELKKINAGSNKVTITDDTGNNELDIDITEANIDHDSLSGFVANEHIDHTAVTLTAGTGMTGTGDISASRTFNVVGGDGIAANADDIAVDFTADKGLHFVSNKLEVEAGTGITLDANGVNVDVGTTANKIVQLDGSAELPAVDGSNLTGITASQVGALANVVEDTTPQLGGTLDMNGQNISTANGFNIDITGSASGDDFTVDTDKFVVEGDTGSVGIGTAAPGGDLHIVNDGASSSLYVDSYSGSPIIRGSQANGTVASPTATTANDDLLSLRGRGYDGAAFSGNQVRIIMEADQNWTNTAQGTRITFDVTARDTTTVSEAMRIDHTGNVGIGDANPGEKLTVAGTIESTSGGIKFPDGSTQTTAATVTPPAGSLLTVLTATCPGGYLATDGSAVSRTTYADLFAAIGTMYGPGDGSTTFNLPDLRGYFLRGWDNGAGNDPSAASRTDRGDGTTGDNVGTKQGNQIQSHDHNVNPPNTATTSDGSHLHNVNPPSTATSNDGAHTHTVSDRYTASGGGANVANGSNKSNNQTSNRTTSSDGNHTHTVNIPAFDSGSAGAHTHNVNIPAFTSGTHGGNETRPKNINVLYCIKI